MADRPITLLPPRLGRVLDGTCREIRYPVGTLQDLIPGDRLWLREQFYLGRQFEHIAPLQALARGAVPVFAVDREFLPAFAVADLGRRRFAREMPKVWHRAHLVVRHVRLEQLHAITPAEITAEGFESRHHYARAWDAGVSLTGASTRWAADPKVLVIGFDAVAAPLALQQESTVR